MRSPLRLALSLVPWAGRRRTGAPGAGWLGGSPATGGRRGSARAQRPESAARFRLGRAPVAPPQYRSPLVRVPWRRLALGALALTLLGGGATGGAAPVWGDAVRVDQVSIDGLEIADPLTVAAAAHVGGESLLWLDTAEVARRVEELPAVREAQVSRDWPSGISIALVEEQGWGYWQRGETRRVIDAEGRVLTRARPPEADAVTIFELAPPDEAQPALLPDRDSVQLVSRLITDGAFERLRVRPESFVFRRDRGLTVVVEAGPNALLGDSHDYDFKVAAWGALLDRIERERLDVTEIDMRFGRHLALR
jgi:hypothetical protein